MYGWLKMHLKLPHEASEMKCNEFFLSNTR